jgi:hypothetical protein
MFKGTLQNQGKHCKESFIGTKKKSEVPHSNLYVQRVKSKNIKTFLLFIWFERICGKVVFGMQSFEFQSLVFY